MWQNHKFHKKCIDDHIAKSGSCCPIDSKKIYCVFNYNNDTKFHLLHYANLTVQEIEQKMENLGFDPLY